jgi:superfamily I DNA and/or RNA helicase
MYQSCYARVRIDSILEIGKRAQRLCITRCKEGKMKERKHALNEKRMVGVTCASTRQDILSSQEFPILILDESSQASPFR